MMGPTPVLYTLEPRVVGCVGEDLKNLMRTIKQIDRQRTDRKFIYRGHLMLEIKSKHNLTLYMLEEDAIKKVDKIKTLPEL